ncbi:3-mercaptopyruvate sulfurtransferase-like [Mya arenaria]|uniref:3-mercaptopyruvate sulfurtransferase-like n=1 Tax=Mya arenaria TaxID=6604 RepID=UPI0022E32BD0|nr:3-mercaptopyruvate sulfurtransferase-like [Mya arenaria]
MLRLGTLVSAKHLAECLKTQANKLRVVDATWFLPNYGRTGIQNYMECHIPGAVFFDIEACTRPSPYEHMLPSEEVFSEYVGNLGIDNETHVVVYNDHPDFALFSAPRVWWTFRAFGHSTVSVLDGGLRMWRDANLDLAKGHETVPVPKLNFNAKFNESFVKSFEDVMKNINEKQFQVVDARPAGRFDGTSPEPRADCKPGHIPGTTSIPFPSVMTSYTGPDGQEVKHGAVKDRRTLEKMFDGAGVDLSRSLTASCGSGVSACVLAFAAHLCGKEDVSVYDGAWVEWYKRSRPDQRENCPD